MCVDPRRLIRAAPVLVSAAVVVFALACGGAQPRQEAAGQAQPAAKVLTAAERATWSRECWAHFNNKAWEKFRACYADAVESEQVGTAGQTRRASRPPWPSTWGSPRASLTRKAPAN